MKIVIAACADDEIGELRTAGHTLGEALIVMDMAGDDHLRMPTGLLGGMLERVFHVRAAGMMIVRGINRMVQRNNEGNVCRQCAQLPDEPFGLQSPRSQLETRNPVQLNQWVTATLRGTDCSENSTDRLFRNLLRRPSRNQTGISNALHPRPYGLFLDDLPIHIRPDLPAARVQT